MNIAGNILKDSSEDKFGTYTDWGIGHPGIEKWWSDAIYEEGNPDEWGNKQPNWDLYVLPTSLKGTGSLEKGNVNFADKQSAKKGL
jgi:hypothetical protein